MDVRHRVEAPATLAGQVQGSNEGSAAIMADSLVSPRDHKARDTCPAESGGDELPMLAEPNTTAYLPCIVWWWLQRTYKE